MNIYVACPVRLGISRHATTYVDKLEKQGHTVFYPPRDVDQHDESGLNICKTERLAIQNCDEVHTFYDARSQGIHFDLGIAFALYKPIKFIMVLVEGHPDYDTGDTKGYLPALRAYEEERCEQVNFDQGMEHLKHD